MKYETMKDLYQAQEKMNELVEKGELKDAAYIGIRIINAFGVIHVINVEAVKVCFGEMSKEDFYKHVIEFSNYYLNEFPTNKKRKKNKTK